MKNEVILGSAYLAPVEYYTKLFAYPSVRVERYDHYMKQTYRNRCVIASADGPLALTIPTEKSDDLKCVMKDVRISDHGNWRHVHWNAFVAAYKHSPFFDYYADDFRVFYEKKYPFLWDFNQELCSLICRLIDIEPQMEGTAGYRTEFAAADTAFIPKPYYQVFKEKHGFLPNLSIADLLFNMGPESLLVLRDSIEPLNL